MPGLLEILVVLVVVAFVCWLIFQLPIDPKFKNIIIGVALFIVVIYLLVYVVPGLLGAHPLHRLG